MAGPHASILFNKRLTGVETAEIKKYIADRSTEVEDDYFWIHEHPFSMTLGPEFDDDLKEYDENGTAKVIEWSPLDIVTLSALCDSQRDHLILGEICYSLAERYSGLVDFHGKLDLPDFSFPGELYVIDHSVDDRFFSFHIGDAQFLKAWIKSDRFKMIK